jgi:hypothetical protein
LQIITGIIEVEAGIFITGFIRNLQSIAIMAECPAMIRAAKCTWRITAAGSHDFGAFMRAAVV